MDDDTEALDRSDPESLCLMARKRSLGGTLTSRELDVYFDLLRDQRWVPDPDDPPMYDWTGGPPQAGGGQMQVRDEAANVLRKCGSDQLVQKLADLFCFQENAEDKTYFASLGIELLGSRHRWVTGLLQHESDAARCSVLRAFEALGWKNHENIDLLAPLLLDPSDDVARIAVSVLCHLTSWYQTISSDVLPPNALQMAVECLRTAEDRQLRLQCMTIVALVGQDWASFAKELARFEAPDLQSIVDMECFGASAMEPLLRCSPSLTQPIKDAVTVRFRATSPGDRITELGQICLFAPDLDAFEMALSEVRLRGEGVRELVRFVHCWEDSMPSILDAAFQGLKRNQACACAVSVLFGSNPKAFAKALLLRSESLDFRTKELAEVLRHLPSPSDGKVIMEELKELLEVSPPMAEISKSTEMPVRSTNCLSNALEPFSESWRTDRVLAAIRAFWQEPEQGLEAIADALESSGCDRTDLLDHLRWERPHRPGCWINRILRRLCLPAKTEPSAWDDPSIWYWHDCRNEFDFGCDTDEHGVLGSIPLFDVDWNAERLNRSTNLEVPFGLFLIPVQSDSLTALSHLTNLVALGIVHREEQEFNGIGHLASLPNLRRLELRGSGIRDEVLKDIAQLTQLCYLGFLNARVADQGLAAISRMSQLESLHLPECNAITDQGISNLCHMNCLKSLNLSSTRVTDFGLRGLGQLATLEHLCLSWNRAITDIGIESVSGLPNLKSLYLFRASISDTALKSLSRVNSMESLMLRETAVTDQGMQFLAKLPNLKVLNLSATAIGNEGMDYLSSCKSIESIELTDSKVSDAGMRSIGKLTNLKTLVVERCAITDQGLAGLKNLAKLESLSLDGGNVTITGLEAIQNFSRLSELRLKGSRFPDVALERLGEMPSLNYLDLGNNTAISEKGVQQLREKLPHCTILWNPPVYVDTVEEELMREYFR